MSGQHAVRHGEQSWFEALRAQQHRDDVNPERAPQLNLPAAVLRGLAEPAFVGQPDGHPSGRSRPRPRVLTVAQLIAKMRTRHQARWAWVCECGSTDCVYQDALTELDPADAYMVARFLRWLSGAHERVASGCACGVPVCEIRQDLDCVDGMALAAASRAGCSS